MTQAAGNVPQDPKSQMAHQVAQHVTEQSLADMQTRKNQWSAFYIARSLASVQSVVLKEVDDMLGMMSKMLNAGAAFNLASGKASMTGAEAKESATLASGAIGLSATSVGSYRLGQKSPERADLDDAHEQLTQELQGKRDGVSAGDRAPPSGRSVDEIKADLDKTKAKIADEQDTKRMYTQMPGQVGQALSSFMSSAGDVAQGVEQMKSAGDQATADIAKSLADRSQALVQQALQLMEAVRSVDYYAPQTRLMG